MVQNALSGQTVSIYQERHDDEEREVRALIDGGGYLLVGEMSAGEVTEFSFGKPSRYHQLVVAPESLPLVVDALGGGEGAGASDVIVGLQRFFTAAGAFLSDLMDVFDGADVPYGYMPSAHRGVAGRYQPARREDGSSY